MEVSAELLKELVNGSRKAQKELFDTFFKPMMRISRSYCSNDDDAKSIVLEAFMDVYDNIKRYNGTGAFKSWFNSIVVNRAINHYNKHKKIMLREQAIEPKIMNESFDAMDEGMNVINKISADEILTLIRTLPETERMVFTLYTLDDLPHKDIGERLGFSEVTSRWYYSNARKKLREKLEKQGINSLSHERA